MTVASWAQRKLQLSTRREGALSVPFPSVDHDTYKAGLGLSDKELNARIREAPIEEVPIARLTAIQRTVNDEQLQKYLDDPEHAPEEDGIVPRDLPIVVRKAGTFYIHDGHHRAASDLVRGGSALRARFVDLDRGI